MSKAGNRTHDVRISRTMLYHLGYKAKLEEYNVHFALWFISFEVLKT